MLIEPKWKEVDKGKWVAKVIRINDKLKLNYSN